MNKVNGFERFWMEKIRKRYGCKTLNNIKVPLIIEKNLGVPLIKCKNLEIPLIIFILLVTTVIKV